MFPIPESELSQMIREAFATQKCPEPPEVPDESSED